MDGYRPIISREILKGYVYFHKQEMSHRILLYVNPALLKGSNLGMHKEPIFKDIPVFEIRGGGYPYPTLF